MTITVCQTIRLHSKEAEKKLTFDHQGDEMEILDFARQAFALMADDPDVKGPCLKVSLDIDTSAFQKEMAEAHAKLESLKEEFEKSHTR